jgi:hypothetical protein
MITGHSFTLSIQFVSVPPGSCDRANDAGSLRPRLHRNWGQKSGKVVSEIGHQIHVIDLGEPFSRYDHSGGRITPSLDVVEVDSLAPNGAWPIGPIKLNSVQFSPHHGKLD